MRTAPECLPCLVRQALLVAQQVTDDPAQQVAAIQIAARYVQNASLDLTPPEHNRLISDEINALLNVDDPYRAARQRYNELCLAGYPALRETVFADDDPLEAAVRVAAVGNIMDLSIFADVSIDAALEAARTTPLAINHLDALARDLAPAQTILILGDNAGEIVFDLPLAELLAQKHHVYYAVKAGPTANDVTYEDAAQVGMDRFATVIDNGTQIMGTPLRQCSPAFLDMFHRADVIISKGQGNYETLSEVDANLYFILKAKCSAVASILDTEIGSVVLKSQRHSQPG